MFLANSIVDKFKLGVRLLLFLLLLQLTLSASEFEFESVLSPGRPPYFQCPFSAKSNLISTYPRLTNPQCSRTFTLCANQVAIPGSCPWGLYFNPKILSCDAPIPNTCYKEELSVVVPRPIVDEPSYNECGYRPCNFYPNGEDDDEGRTFVFCQFGKAKIRKCPRGSAFCTRAEDCIPSEQAHVFIRPPLAEGKREPGNPLLLMDDITSNDSTTSRGRFNPIAIDEPENEIVVIQTPINDKYVLEDAHWSQWYLCPNGTFMVKLSSKHGICMPIKPGLDPDRSETQTILHLAKKRRIYFPTANCDKGQGGAMVSFRINTRNKLVEFFCSNDHPPDTGDWCPVTKAICGISFLHGRQKDVSNVRARCCPVDKPEFQPQERLEYIDTLDNLKGTQLKPMFFNSTYGIAVATGLEEKAMRVFYMSLGFTIDYVWKELEMAVRTKTICEKGRCRYNWKKYTVKSRTGLRITNKITVQPKSKVHLFQVYAQVGYFRIYTNLFIKRKERLAKETLEERWEGPRLEVTTVSVTTRGVLAENKTVDRVLKKVREKEGELSKFLNLTASKEVSWEDKCTAVIKTPKRQETKSGDWQEWKNCSRREFVNRIKLGRKPSVGVIKLEMSCESIQGSGKIRTKRTMEDNERSSSSEEGQEEQDVKNKGKKGKKGMKEGRRKEKGENEKPTMLDFTPPGKLKKDWSEEDNLKCEKGVGIGFQVKTGKVVEGMEELRLVCSDESKDLTQRKGWSEAEVCEPLYAVSGFLAKYDEKGLVDFKIRCHHIVGIAAKCTPKAIKKHVATCAVDKSSTSCIFKAPLGVTYNFNKSATMPQANLMESVGHTLSCAYVPLNKNFKKNIPEASYWKDAFWHPLTSLTAQIFKLPSNAVVQIFQKVGLCGPYIVYTNHFSHAEMEPSTSIQEFDIPLVPGPALPNCWIRDKKHKKNIDDGIRKMQPPIKMMSMEESEDEFNFFIQRPSSWIPSSGTVWSPWKLCNDGTHVSEIRKDGMLCQPILGLGEAPARNLTKYVFYDLPNIALPPQNCNKVGGGAIVGFKKLHLKPLEYFCSTTKPQASAAGEWCPPATAMCGLSIQYNPSLRQVENARLKCCPLTGPAWDTAREGLAHITTFDNTMNHVWRKFKFDTGHDGVIVHDKDKLVGKYWTSLGYTWETSGKEIEESIIFNTICNTTKDMECMYPWPNFKFSSDKLLPLQKQILVPPFSILKLYQIYAAVGYFRVYVNRFVQVIRDTKHNTEYEEVRDIRMDDDDGDDSTAGRDKVEVPQLVLATNLSTTGYDKKLEKLFCSYHNLTSKTDVDVADIDSMYWISCAGSKLINKVQFMRSKSKKKRGPVNGLEVGCKNVGISGQSITMTTNDDDVPTDGDVMECRNGVMVGYQTMGYDYEFLCSCKEEDEENGVFGIQRDRSICKPMQGLVALEPTYTGEGKEKRLTSLQKVCADVPLAAQDCKPYEDTIRILVARCSNGEDRAQDCVFKVKIGIAYNLDSKKAVQTANTLESVGHTIPCSSQHLKANFQSNSQSPLWQEPIWYPMVDTIGKITNIPENSDTEIYQVVGRCGPYVVHTNKFAEIPEGEFEPRTELTLPLQEIAKTKKCWKDERML